MYDAIVVGTGFSGAICARKLADSGYKVLVLEKRSHIGGNMYDYFDKNYALIHKYGPHVIMTNEISVVNFIKSFDEIVNIEVKMEAALEGKKIVPLPINLNAIRVLYPDLKAQQLSEELIRLYGYGEEIHVLDMLTSENRRIKKFAEDIYREVFLNYNIKMWGRNRGKNIYWNI